MQDCVYPTLATALGSFYVAGEQTPRAGNRHPGQALAPYNVYEAKDGHVAIICIREGHWRKLCQAMGRPELIDDPRYATFGDRTADIDQLDAVVTEWTSSLTRAEIFELTQEHGVICAPVQNLQEVVDDPHLAARGTVKKRPHEAFGEIAQMHTPLRYRDIEPPPLTGPPELGDATDRVLDELLGLDPAEIARLRAAEAI